MTANNIKDIFFYAARNTWTYTAAVSALTAWTQFSKGYAGLAALALTTSVLAAGCVAKRYVRDRRSEPAEQPHIRP